jgi:hypothetical protein
MHCAPCNLHIAVWPLVSNIISGTPPVVPTYCICCSNVALVVGIRMRRVPVAAQKGDKETEAKPRKDSAAAATLPAGLVRSVPLSHLRLSVSVS